MSAIFVLIGFSTFVALIFLIGYLWSVKSGQYDDSYTPSIRILFDNENDAKKQDSKLTDKDTKNN